MERVARENFRQPHVDNTRQEKFSKGQKRGTYEGASVLLEKRRKKRCARKVQCRDDE